MSGSGDLPARLTRSQLADIARQGRRVKYSTPISGDPRGMAPLGRAHAPMGLVPAVAVSNFTARSGSTPGTGTAHIYYLDDGATVVSADPQLTAVTVYNWYSGIGPASGKYILIFAWSGVWWLAGVDC